MQTFLPYEDFEQTAACLDMKRLGKQRVEVLQILKALSGVSRGWSNHPATKMWKGHEMFLIKYGVAVCTEWRARGYKDTCLEKITEFTSVYSGNTTKPKWLGNKEFHDAHKSNLLRKNSVHYNRFNWAVDPDASYIWPESQPQ